MKKRLLLYFIVVGLILSLLFILSKFLYPPAPISVPLSKMLPASPAVYLHCSGLQERLTAFTQHEQFRQLLNTPYVQRLLQNEEGQAQLASFHGLLEDKLLSPMQFIGKDLAVALYRSSNESTAQPAVILLSRVSDKAKLAERVFYAFDWLTEIGVEKLPLKLHNYKVHQVQHQDLLFPFYYSLVSDVAIVTSSLELLETAVIRIAGEEQKQEQEASLFNELVEGQPDSRFVTAFVDPPVLADELSSNLFFSAFYLANIESVEAMRETTTLFSVFDIYPESIRLQAEVLRSPEKRSDSPVAKATSTCWDSSEPIRQFPLLLDISPEALNAFVQKLQESFPQLQEWKNPFPGYRLWDTAIECRIASKPVGKVYALPDLLCASDSALTPEESVALIDKLLNTILEQQVPPMLRSTMLRQERSPYQEIPVSSLQVMFQDVFSYTALANEAGDAFNILASNSAAVRQGIDKVRAATEARPGYCTNVPQKQTSSDAGSGAMLPAAGLWLQPGALARFIEDFSQTNSFELLFPRRKNPELYAQLPQVRLILRSLPPMFLELGLQEENPIAKLWSQGYYIDE